MSCCVKNTIVIIIFILGAINASAQNIYEVVSSSKLNVRELPNSTSSVLGTLNPKEQIDVLELIGEWAVFKFNNHYAYVSSEYLKKIDVESLGKYKVISSSHLNIRLQPTTSSAVVGTLQPDTLIEVLSNNGLWAKIRYKEKSGYISSKYIEEIEEVVEATSEVKEVILVEEPIVVEPDSVEEIIVVNDKKNLRTIDKIGIEFVPNVYCGFSNFSSDDASPKGTIGCGIDLAIQFIAKDNIAFLPKNYFMESSLGYSLRGSAAFPMHYINFKLLPFGYRYNLSEFTLFGKLGVYTGYTFSSIETYNESFDSNIDNGMTICIGAEYKQLGVGMSYERGFTNVCNSNLNLVNQCVFVNLSYRLYSFK